MVDELLILAYHRVGKPDPGARYKGQFVTPEHLGFQVQHLLRAGYHFDTLTRALRTRGKRAVVTFDDGYHNNLTHGLPVLSRLRVPATVFVVTNDVGKHGVVWAEAGESNPADLLSWQDLRQLQGFGWEIGSHCSEHVHLARKSPEEQRVLIELSHKTIKTQLGSEEIPFAYPYGSFASSSPSLVAAAGFSCAVTMLHGRNLDSSDLFTLQRLPMKGYRLDHYVRSVFWLRGKTVSHY